MGAAELEELRRLAARHGIPLALVDRLSLRIREAAHAIGVSTRKVRALVEEGRLPASRVDGAIVVPVMEILRFLEANPYVPTKGEGASVEETAAAFIDGLS